MDSQLGDPMRALARTEQKAEMRSVRTAGALTVVTESAPFTVDHIYAGVVGSTACVKHTPEVSTCVRPGPPPLGGVGAEWIQAGPRRISPFHRPPVACVASGPMTVGVAGEYLRKRPPAACVTRRQMTVCWRASTQEQPREAPARYAVRERVNENILEQRGVLGGIEQQGYTRLPEALRTRRARHAG